MYYPILFDPIYKRMIWGGDRLAALFGRALPYSDVGESWDISCRAGDMGTVRNGRLIGTTFAQLIGIDRAGYLGHALCKEEAFPLLIKLIDANADLSVQVHPGDKNEAWYVVYAAPGARIAVGLAPGVTKEAFAEAIRTETVERCLRYIHVKAGDVINLPAGTVHAICAGLVIAEVQQNSNTTYRVYDYGRTDDAGNRRQLHVAEALAAIDFHADSPALLTGEVRETADARVIFYCETPHYALYEYRVETRMRECSDPERFFVFTCIEGGCEIHAQGYCATIAAGDSVLIPAALGAYEIVGRARLLKSFVPA